jgi:hypothetical protein
MTARAGSAAGAGARRALSGPLVSLATLLVLVAAVEAGFRAYRRVRHGEDFFARVGYPLQDPVLGWRGLQDFGDPAAARFKVFFVGDSYTFRKARSPVEDQYYSVVGRAVDVEVFAYGGAGYGTLQEYLVIDQQLDRIRPDLVVLQTTANDFVNNHWPLEKASRIHNNYLIRPYLEGDEVVYRFPRGPAFLRERLMPRSHLLYFVVSRLDRIHADRASRGKADTVEEDIVRSGGRDPRFLASVQVTDRLIERIVARCGKVPLVAFPVLDEQPYLDAFRAIFARHGVPFLDQVPQLAWQAQARSPLGEGVGLHGQGHWNRAGHAACGAYLASYLRQRFGVAPAPARAATR